MYHSETIFFRYPRVPRPAYANRDHLLETNTTRHELEAHLKPTNPTWEILNMRPSRKKTPKSQAIPLGFIVQPLTLKFQANYSSFTTLTMTVYEEFQEQKLHNTWERKKKIHTAFNKPKIQPDIGIVITKGRKKLKPTKWKYYPAQISS